MRLRAKFGRLHSFSPNFVVTTDKVGDRDCEAYLVRTKTTLCSAKHGK